MSSFAPIPSRLGPEQAAGLLRGAGMAATAPRVAILRALRAACDHPSPEVLHERLRGERPDLSLATVYKALHAFARAGLVHEVSVAGDNRRRFDANLDVHHHLVCTVCHEVRDLYDGGLADLRPPPTPAGFQAQGVSVNVLGRCARCAERVAPSLGRRPTSRSTPSTARAPRAPRRRTRGPRR